MYRLQPARPGARTAQARVLRLLPRESARWRVRVCAHELNQPLTAIAMYSKSAKLLAQQGQQQKLLEVIDKVAQQSHRAGAVIERMQSMSYQSSHQQDQVNPTDLLKEIKDLAEIEAQVRHFSIDLKLPQHLPLISCDPIQIQQVILQVGDITHFFGICDSPLLAGRTYAF